MAQELSSFFSSILPELVPDGLRSFGAGGQIYNSELVGGFNVSANLENPLFTFRQGEGSVANSNFLTNLREAGKIGSTMEFLCTHVGVRIVKIKGAGTANTAAEVQAMKALLASATIELGLGSDSTKIGEFSGMHFMSPIDTETSDISTVTAVSSVGGACANGFIRLRMPIPMQRNVELRGSVKFAQAPAAALTSTADSYGFVVILYGLKVVST